MPFDMGFFQRFLNIFIRAKRCLSGLLATLLLVSLMAAPAHAADQTSYDDINGHWAYVVLGITIDGTKYILGAWIGEHESSKFWLNGLNDLKSRGVLDVYLFCVDGLKGFMEAIGAVYPHSQVQRYRPPDPLLHPLCQL